MQYSRPGNALKKARNIKPFGAANRNRRPAFSPAFSSCVPGFSGGFLRPCRRRNSRLDGLRVKMPARRLRRPEAPGNCLPRSAPPDRTGPKLRGAAFHGQRRKKLRVEGQDGLPEIPAVSARPAFVQHIAATVQRQAQARFPVIVGAHPRDKGTDFLLFVTGQLPGVHSGLRATMARRAGLHDQRPEFLPALSFPAFALLVVAASGTRVIAAPARPRHFLHHSLKGAVGKIHWRASCSSVSSSHGGVSSSSGSSAISSGPSSSYSQ